MKKNNLTFLTIFGVLLIFLSSCSLNSDADVGGIGGLGSSSSGGGVNLEYASSNIQPQKGVPFRILFNVENNQRHPVDVEFRATGFEWDYVTGDITSWRDGDRKTITAASDTNPGQLRVILDNTVLDGFSGDFTWNPTFKYCYEAKSTFRQQVCIPNSLGNTCENDVDSNTNSNGPLGVKINNILPIGKDSIRIEFTISNSNGGVVVNDCFQEEMLNDYGNEFLLGDVKLGATSGTCKPVGTDSYVINDNSARFACDFSRSGSNDEAYASQVVVDVTSYYQQQVKQNIQVRDLSVS